VIVDAHAHLGYDYTFDEEFAEAELLASQRDNGINVTLVQPGTAHDLRTAQAQHDAIADLARRHPGRFHGIANPSPYLPEKEYTREVRRCVRDLGFRGVKLHPYAHGVNPLGRSGRRVFALADELGLPVMVHTGSGLPWSAPSLLGPIAAEHPQLKIVAAHAGGMMMAGEAGLLAAQHDNVCLEPSWVGGFVVREWVRRLGPQRIMFGSDHADNAAAELVKLRSADLSEEELSWVLGRTAAVVFGLTWEEAR